MLALLPALRRYSRSLTRSDIEGEDLLQDCVEKVLVHGNQWRGGSFKSWTYRIMTNLHLNRRRTQQRHPTVPIDEAAATAEPEMATDPLENRRLMAALETLAPEFRAVLMLVVVEGHSYQEVADMLDIPLGTVMSRLSRARHALREKLRQENVIQMRRPQ
ncbi:RNA polymerase sigma factor [Neorhizobium sp. JUb45]|uniref:RNA polymerase sigma factor n=2 Tax=unclassified Neorhizobium TaxID=2629175 RepID=UPI0010D63CEB|nr:RNA polymerase sigma factor [Neorhizobium sp. JUb45]TCR07082.1 RNA polymerase sigma-70 factor (ECF subfamily) [Neorhizobium sp. JUb45]